MACAPRWDALVCVGATVYAELFFAALKNERVHRTVYPTKAHAQRDVFHYIEGFYNTRRGHLALDYQRPAEVHYGELRLATAA